MDVVDVVVVVVVVLVPGAVGGLEVVDVVAASVPSAGLWESDAATGEPGCSCTGAPEDGSVGAAAGFALDG